MNLSLSDPKLCQALLEKLRDLTPKPLQFMEVCGTHTVSIFRSGLRSLLPENIRHLSGPGCPVCVTHESEIATILALAQQPKTIIATFGDLMRVPDAKGQSLNNLGLQTQVIYSPLDALQMAEAHPDQTVVLLGIGFETTAPSIAATILQAKARNLNNFCVYSCHKLVPPALQALLAEDNVIDALLLPGHVSTVLGLAPYAFIPELYHKPAIVAGFEPADILDGLCRLAKQYQEQDFKVENAYPRGVKAIGNPKAREILEQVFIPVHTKWRGLGLIPQSGLALRDEYADFAALKRYRIEIPAVSPTPCKCGEILKGKLQPLACPLFKTVCTPAKPMGPCMVSSEGSCAAYFRYSA